MSASSSLSESEEGPGPAKRTRKTAFPLSKVKALVREDEEIGKVAQTSLVLISKAMELFARELMEAGLAEAAKTDGKTKVTLALLQDAIRNNDKFDFLRPLLQAQADEEAAAEAPAPANSNVNDDNNAAEPPQKKQVIEK